MGAIANGNKNSIRVERDTDKFDTKWDSGTCYPGSFSNSLDRISSRVPYHGIVNGERIGIRQRTDNGGVVYSNSDGQEHN